MKQIFNWTIGSFFRSIGRIAAYLIIGGIITYLVTSGGYLRNIKLTDLIGLECVKADSWQTHFMGTMTENDVELQFDTDLLYDYVYKSSNTNQFYDTNIFFSNPVPRTTPINYIKLYGVLKGASLRDDETLTCHNTNSQGQCTSWSSSSEFSVRFQVWFGGNTNQCTIEWNLTPTYNSFQNELYFVATCPFDIRYSQNNFFRFRYNVMNSNNQSYKLDLNRNLYILSNDTQNIINAQNQTTNSINSMNQTISDTNTTSDTSSASSFFGDYNETATDGVAAIVSMPLNIFNALTTGSTKDLCFTLKGKQSCFPSGAILWNKSSRSSIHVGNATWTPHPFSDGGSLSTGLSAFKILFNVVVSGFLGYKMLKSIMRIVNDMLNPTKDKVEVLEL